MKKAILLVSLLLVALLLVGCAAKENPSYPEANTVMQRDPLTLAENQDDGDSEEESDTAFNWDEGDYDPSAEEDAGDASFVPTAVYDDLGNVLYAGATPIPLDPIDMPTATPRPALTFTYGMVELNNLKLSFEGPAGWTVDASANDTVVITDPNTYDGVNASMTVSITSVPSTYKLNDVKNTVRDKLKEIGQYNYSEWHTTDVSARTLLKKDGFYSNYRGVLYNGTVVRGRVMVALLDGNRIITVHMSCPGWYNESYMNVVAKFRDTVKLK